MKTYRFIACMAFICLSLFSFAQSKSETIKVWGNCGMCKSHIEKAAKEGGASYAAWNKDTKMLSIKYEASKTSNQQIQEKVAAAGYDTKDLTADDKAYKNLDECYQYERKPAVKKDTTKQLAKSCCDKPAICDKSICKPSVMECCKNEVIKHACYKNPANSCCAG